MTYHLFTYLWRNIYLSLFLSFWSDILLLRFRITLIMLHYSLHYGYWSLSDVHFANIFFCFVSDLLLCWWLPFPVLIYDVLFCPVSLFFFFIFLFLWNLCHIYCWRAFCATVLNILYLGVWSILSSFPYYSLTLTCEYALSTMLFVEEIVFSPWRDLGILVKLPSFLLLLAHCSVFYTTSTWFDSFCCIFLFQNCLLLFEMWCFKSFISFKNALLIYLFAFLTYLWGPVLKCLWFCLNFS